MIYRIRSNGTLFKRVEGGLLIFYNDFRNNGASDLCRHQRIGFTGFQAWIRNYIKRFGEKACMETGGSRSVISAATASAIPVLKSIPFTPAPLATYAFSTL